MFRAHQIKTAVLRSVLLLPLVGLTGCIGTSSRLAMTPEHQDLAFVNDPALARFWADEVTPDLEAVVAHQFMQVKNAAKQGVRPRSLRQADYLAISGGGGNGAFAAGLIRTGFAGGRLV